MAMNPVELLKRISAKAKFIQLHMSACHQGEMPADLVAIDKRLTEWLDPGRESSFDELEAILDALAACCEVS